MMRILFLSGWYPDPPNNGSKLRIINLIRGLSQNHEVSLLSFIDESDSITSGSEMEKLCMEVKVVPIKHFDPQSWLALKGYFSLKPRSVLATYSQEMDHKIRELLAETKYDLIVASQREMAGYFQCFGDVPSLLEEVEVALLYEQYSKATKSVDKIRHGLTWTKQKYYLNHLINKFSAVTVVSDQEKQLLADIDSDITNVEVIPNCINLSEYSPIREKPKQQQLIFTGSFRYFANYDAMTWFLKEVFPYIRMEVPGIQLFITGDHANLPLPSEKNVTLTGFVDDVRPLIALSWCSLVPLRVGGGTRLKILEAMALRTPVVATTKGAEGLGAQHGQHLLIADTPQTFAEMVMQLICDPDLHQHLAENAYKFVSQHYDCAVTNQRFLDLAERVANV